MATLNTVVPETFITIRLQHGGQHKRTKLMFKDLKPDILPAKLRTVLNLPADEDVDFERWSDSAGAFIKLDPSNLAVYKQLNRAARAKLKLRIKVTSAQPEQPQTQTFPGLEQFLSRMSNANDLDIAGLHISPTQPPAPADVAATNRDFSGDDQEEETRRRTQDQMSRALNSVHNYAQEVEQTMVNDYASAFGAKMPSYEPPAGDVTGASIDALPSYPSPPYNLFSVCCNKCNYAIPEHHWHCNVCEEGDFDLCQKCLDAGAHCNVPDHYLVKRTLEDGKIVPSKSYVATKTRIGEREEPSTEEAASAKEVVTDVPGAFNDAQEENEYPALSRTCNSCINIDDDSQFVTCKDCDDYDLCIPCHLAGNHGHHPAHTFGPAIEDMILEDQVAAACEPGRNQHHDATCDGCDMHIFGVRHKCLECPDWDYCSTCHKSAQFIHPGHRFVPIYEPLQQAYECRGRNDVHVGVRCDGPLCSGKKYILGVRYKCAICDDTDFCASCEALPTNTHNRTHPMIKFRTPMKDVSITTYHGLPHGTEVVGDRQPQVDSKGTETTPLAQSSDASTQVQTESASAQQQSTPTEPVEKDGEETDETVQGEEKEKEENKEEEREEQEEVSSEQASPLDAFYIRDYISDGTKVVPGQKIYQNWTLYNPSTTPWPKGCALRWAGGDHMLDVDATSPGSIDAIDAASMSNATYTDIGQGGEYSFSVQLRAPSSTGRSVSYWRLYSPEGKPFGHRLWCDVEVVAHDAEAEEVKTKSEKQTEELSESQMVFPRLEKESPSSSTHLEASVKVEAADVRASSPIIAEEAEELLSHDDVESVTVDLDNDDDTTDDGFLTDEDYDMLEDTHP